MRIGFPRATWLVASLVSGLPAVPSGGVAVGEPDGRAAPVVVVVAPSAEVSPTSADPPPQPAARARATAASVAPRGAGIRRIAITP